MAIDYRRHATIKRQGSGSWAAHVISRQTGKRVLLGTYHTEALAREAVDRYATGEEKKPAAAPEPARAPVQTSLFAEDD